MKEDRGYLALMSCESGKGFSDLVVNHLKDLYVAGGDVQRFRKIDSTEAWFANGEVKTVIKQPIRGADVYIIQLLDDPLSERSVNDNLMALATAVNAAFNSDAASVTAVIPQFPSSRQERRKGRESLTASMISGFLENCGARRILTIDIHAEAIQGFFRKAKLDNLHASNALMGYLKKKELVKAGSVIVAPDVGSAETARYYSRELKKDMAIVVKERDYTKTSVVISTRLVGSVEDKDVVIIDDMIATGGTLIAACETMKGFGAKDINVAVTFPFFNGKAVEKIDAAYEKGIIKSVIGTNAVFRGEKFKNEHPWYHEVDISRFFAEVIYKINHMQSISEALT